MSPFGLKFSQIILHTETSKLMYNWSFLFEVLHKPTLLPSTFNFWMSKLGGVLIELVYQKVSDGNLLFWLSVLGFDLKLTYHCLPLILIQLNMNNNCFIKLFQKIYSFIYSTTRAQANVSGGIVCFIPPQTMDNPPWLYARTETRLHIVSWEPEGFYW